MDDIGPTTVDYLVVGAGGMGMAFADTLAAETDAVMAIVDRGDRPGGHWTRAYPYVRLHQPSAFYGVASRELGTGRRDATGGNAGLYELASADEILAYYDRVMRTTLLPTGRVSYLPRWSYEGPLAADGERHRVRSLVTGTERILTVRRRVVDATYLDVTVPAMRPPPFDVGPGASVVTPGGLAGLGAAAEHHAVVGAGKTGIDVCLWLLEHGADPDRITWVVPRDPWLLDRSHLQPGEEFLDTKLAAVRARMRAVSGASSTATLFAGLERAGTLLRVFDDVEPSTYRCATVTRSEVAALRRIRHVVRLGHVRRLDRGGLVLDHGRAALPAGTVAVDATADGLARRPARAVFDGPRLTLQAIVPCQQVASAAVVAHVEAAFDDDDRRNALCVPAPHPDSALDWIEMQIAVDDLMLRWAVEPRLREWTARCRLFGIAGGPPAGSEAEVGEFLAALGVERAQLATLGHAGRTSPAVPASTEHCEQL